MAVRKRIFYFFLMALCALTALKILFVGYDIDEQYAVSMAYRLLKGDRLLTDLWEPHQTSGWLCMLLMAPYLAVFHTTAGVVLYLRFCGLLLHLAVGFFLYRTLRSYLQRDHALGVCCIYFFALPKIMFLPEFSNIQMWCLLMAALCLLRYYGPRSSQPGSYMLGYLVLAGCFLALEVLSYPSTILAFFVCMGCIIHYRGRSPHSLTGELICLIIPCLLGAATFMALLLSYIPLGSLGKLISIVASDGSHSAPWGERLSQHGQSLGQILVFFLVYSLVALLLQLLYRHRTQKPFSALLWCQLLIGCTLAGQVCIWLFGEQYPNYPMAEYLFLPLLLLGAAARRKVHPSPALAFLVLTPLAAFMGILLFSNHPLLVSLPFLAPCAIGILSLPQLQETLTTKNTGRLMSAPQVILVLWVCVLLFGRCYMQRTTGGRHETILDEISLMRQGPALGLAADTPSVIRYRDNLALVSDVLPEGARVFYMGADTDIYLMKELEYCTPSTICSPTFDDKVYTWFELHPDRLPDYVVCDAGLLYTDPWVISYVRDNCQDNPVGANDYLAIYQYQFSSPSKAWGFRNIASKSGNP